MNKLEKVNRLAAKADAKVAKRVRKKDELADSAIAALKQLGYARTSLRDIAELSGVAVGTLHYYFDDKVDLIAYCVRRYKVGFVAEMQSILSGDAPPERLAERFVSGLALSIHREAKTHRLWYDIRSQAMFDPSFHQIVEDIEAGLVELVEEFLERTGHTHVDATSIYLLLDAAFRYHLQKLLTDDSTAPADFEDLVMGMLRTVSRAARIGR